MTIYYYRSLRNDLQRAIEYDKLAWVKRQQKKIQKKKFTKDWIQDATINKAKSFKL